MNNQEIYNTLELPFWNKSWFARKLYPSRKKAPDYFYRRLNNKLFTIVEMNKLNLIFKKIANMAI